MSNLPDGRSSSPISDLATEPIRTQLLLATLFPLVLFGLLSTLVIATAFRQFSLDLVRQRNTAQIQALSAMLSQKMDEGTLPDTEQLRSASEVAGVINSAVVYLINSEGQPVVSSDPTIELMLSSEEITQLNQTSVPSSKLMESSSTNDEVLVSTAVIPGMEYRVVLVEQWKTIMTPSTNYQLLLAGLMLLGIVLAHVGIVAVAQVLHIGLSSLLVSGLFLWLLGASARGRS